VYPWIEVAEIDRDKGLLGCGPEDYVETDQTSGDKTSVKILVDATSVRFTVHAASTAEKNGGEIVLQLLDGIEESI
jgi:endo-1,4-beta-D-glucanase Y